MSLSIVFGTPRTLRPCSACSRLAAPSVSSPPIAISPSSPSSAIVVGDRRRAVVALERVRPRGAEDRPAARQDPARRLDRQLLVVALERPAPAVAKADDLVAVDVDPLADDRADDRVQPGAVAAACEDPESHAGARYPAARGPDRQSASASRRAGEELDRDRVRIVGARQAPRRRARHRQNPSRSRGSLAGWSLPRPDVEVGLGVLLVAGRGAVVGAPAALLGAGLERDVEVLRPEDDRRRLVADRRRRPHRLERPVAERVELGERSAASGSISELGVVLGNAVEEQLRADEARRRRRARSSSGGVRARPRRRRARRPSTRTCSDVTRNSNGGVPKPPGVGASAISLCGLRAGATICSATRCKRLAGAREGLGKGREAHGARR